ncbi:GGDEF domain-containing protein [Devosia sp. RR2S18]|uniref:GGDEF domain-containing protein n=1 Tax=Devosia rhizosphaerae TaxID=3049774 RepID=UPI0025409603|nr:GGDEF domain-containing protein [Devosia sp. RR2S18]WIJ24135.1 GGDEF domain-containing protein [Devosia sp. RR2S18]
MPFDYRSLLVAIIFSGGAMSLTLVSAWLTARQDRFLMTWAAGMMVLVAATITFAAYDETGLLWIGALAFMLLPSGCAIVWGASRQFRSLAYPMWHVLALCGTSAALMSGTFAFGVTGVGIISSNVLAGALLAMTGLAFWSSRAESPALMSSLFGLYLVSGASFVLCGVALLSQQQFVVQGMPDNWAEDLNALVSIIGITGIGAISVALNHSRLALRHQSEARTDNLTGLTNRRSLFEIHNILPPRTAVILFDLDDFKAINDSFGHAAGDTMLQAFAQCIRETMPPHSTAARIGGEEFAIVMEDMDGPAAMFVADSLRLVFGASTIRIPSGSIRGTVSAGVANSGDLPSTLDEVLRRADDALYAAKRQGRNRVNLEAPRLVAIG